MTAARRVRRAIAATVLICALPITSVDAAPSGGALVPPLTLVLQIAGEGDVPYDAVGVALNVTVTNPIAAGFLTVYPCGQRPLASNLNYVADQTVPNFVIAALDEDGAVCIDTMTTTDVVVDLAGYIPAGSDVSLLPAPTRFLDTRTGLGVPRRVGGLTVTEVPLAGAFGVPADAQSVVINATVVDPEAAGYISVFPCDADGALTNGGTSTLNFAAGQIVPNLVITAVGAAGKVCIYSTVGADLVADVAAYVPAGGTGLTTTPFPQRFVDTRFGVGGPVAHLGSDVRTVAIGGVNGVPEDTAAVIANITATRGSAAGYITAFPCGQPAPLVSNVNFLPGQSIANMAVVTLGPGGQLCMRAMVPVDVIVDVTGYVTGTSAFVALPPSRVYDSREGVDPPCGFAVRFEATGSGAKVFRLVSMKNTSMPTIRDQPAWTEALSAAIDPWCDVYLLGLVDGTQMLYKYSQDDGSLVRLAQGANARDVAASVRGALMFGSAGGAEGGDIYDFWRGAVILSLPPNPVNEFGGVTSRWKLIGVSDDASLIVVARPAEQNRAEVAYYDGDGQPLGTIKLAPATLVTDVSPDGAYLAVITNWLEGGPLSLSVMTLDGTVVATLPNVYGAQFMSSGSLAVCHQPSVDARVVRWDLFGPPTALGNGPAPGCGQLLDVR